jgi:hypothetical protein
MLEVGRHRITQGNIAGGQLQRMLASLPMADFAYTDPPWGTGNLRYWDTMNKKATGDEIAQIDQHELEGIVCDTICRYVRHYAFIVYGKREADSLASMFFQRPNVSAVQIIPKQYRSGSKWMDNVVIAVTLNDAPERDWLPVLKDKNGMDGLKVICNEFAGKYQYALDMFIGIGYYLKALDRAGFTVYGNELNRARLEKASGRIRAS